MLEDMNKQLADEELEHCYIEIYNWRQVGTLEVGSKLREVENEYKLRSGNKDYPIHKMPEHILFEIATRKYREDGINV
ncbi:hypothetical protein [Gorillibacterium massiliense]|uniref:hypothetical protein n=1 Tax=Gorillibacterium massiliense TaxID=1280390 RepID=UPI0004AF9FCB|nr:hypothetical protein [Gorillibacterium massiliense]